MVEDMDYETRTRGPSAESENFRAVLLRGRHLLDVLREVKTEWSVWPQSPLRPPIPRQREPSHTRCGGGGNRLRRAFGPC